MAWFQQREEDKWTLVYEVTQETASFSDLITIRDKSYLGRAKAKAIIRKLLEKWGDKDWILLESPKPDNNIDPRDIIFGNPCTYDTDFIILSVLKEDVEKLETDESVKIKCYTNCESEEDFLKIVKLVND